MAADPKYTVFIRVPIPRGDFVDPPPVSGTLILGAIVRCA